MQLAQGTDLDFVNLDISAVTNGHQIVSFKRKNGRPLIRSPRVDGPGDGDGYHFASEAGCLRVLLHDPLRDVRPARGRSSPLGAARLRL